MSAGAGELQPQPASARPSSAGLAPTSPLLVAIDFRQPQSYLAHGPTRQLAAACGVAIDWRPFPAPALRPPAAESPGDDRTARHLRFRARYLETDLRRYAAAQGLPLGDLYRSPDPSLAGIGLLFANRAGDRRVVPRAAVDAYVAATFAGYWSGQLDLEDEGAIRRTLAAAGVDVTEFRPGALRDDYDRSLIRLREAGVIEAPAYFVGDELFIGRAHLPVIRWLLQGKVGPPPA